MRAYQPASLLQTNSLAFQHASSFGQNCILGFVVVGVCIFWSGRGYDENPQKPNIK